MFIIIDNLLVSSTYSATTYQTLFSKVPLLHIRIQQPILLRRSLWKYHSFLPKPNTNGTKQGTFWGTSIQKSLHAFL